MKDSNSLRGTRGPAVRRGGLAVSFAAATLAGRVAIAQADTPPRTEEGSLTSHGITVYGTVDIGFQYDSHSPPQSDYHLVGTGALIQRNAQGSQAIISGSNLAQSKVGVQGREEFGNGWAGIFRLETFFNPWSGQISDALKAMTVNNGVPAAQQRMSADSSIAGQLFNGAAYAGVSHNVYGTLAFGWQNTVLTDGINKYDPITGSNAFSVLGFSGTPAGGGATEDRRLASSLKYDVTYDGLHFGILLQPKTGANPGTTEQFALGWNFPGGSVDVFWDQKNGAIQSAPLSATQVATLNNTYASGGGGGNPLDKSLVGTITDNTVFSIMGKYTLPNKLALFAGYEHIDYSNPATPVAPGQQAIGGYVLAYIAAPLPSDRILQVSWIGARYPVSPKLDLMGGYYRWDQNSYSTAHPGCSSAAVSGQCSGSQNALSLVGDYHFTKRFDAYAGAMWSEIGGGLANGALQTSNIDPTIGVKYQF